MRAWLAFVLIGGCECNAKTSTPVAPIARTVELPKLGDTKPVPLDAPEDAIVLGDSTPVSLGEEAYQARRVFFATLARDIKRAGSDCGRLDAIARVAIAEAPRISRLGSAVTSEREVSDRAALEGVVKMISLANCPDNGTTTKLLDELK
jgi:hypothetical protein